MKIVLQQTGMLSTLGTAKLRTCKIKYCNIINTQSINRSSFYEIVDTILVIAR